jgi:hypothetical protein
VLPTPCGEGRERLGQPVPRRAPRVTPLDEVHQRVTDGLRQVHIHLGHPQRQYVGLLEAPLDAAPLPQLVHGQVEHHGSALGDQFYVKRDAARRSPGTCGPAGGGAEGCTARVIMEAWVFTGVRANHR